MWFLWLSRQCYAMLSFLSSTINIWFQFREDLAWFQFRGDSVAWPLTSSLSSFPFLVYLFFSFLSFCFSHFDRVLSSHFIWDFSSFSLIYIWRFACMLRNLPSKMVMKPLRLFWATSERENSSPFASPCSQFVQSDPNLYGDGCCTSSLFS